MLIALEIAENLQNCFRISLHTPPAYQEQDYEPNCRRNFWFFIIMSGRCKVLKTSERTYDANPDINQCSVFAWLCGITHDQVYMHVPYTSAAFSSTRTVWALRRESDLAHRLSYSILHICCTIESNHINLTHVVVLILPKKQKSFCLVSLQLKIVVI